MTDRDAKLKKIDAYLDYILKVHKQNHVSDEFFCDFMLTLALDYYDAHAKNDAVFVLKALGTDLINQHLDTVLAGHPDLLDDLELLVAWLKPKKPDYTFNGPRGQA